jgi:hypothetical protein
MNPVPHEDAAADIAKMFEQNLQRKSEFRENRNSAKNDFRKLPQSPDFRCLYVYLKNGVFDKFWLKIGNFCGFRSYNP